VRRKLLLVVLATTGFALLLTGASVAYFDLRSFRGNLVANGQLFSKYASTNQRSISRSGTHDYTCTANTDRFNRLAQYVGATGRFEGIAGPAAGHFLDRLQRILFLAVHGVRRAKLLRHLQPRRHHVYRNDRWRVRSWVLAPVCVRVDT